MARLMYPILRCFSNNIYILYFSIVIIVSNHKYIFLLINTYNCVTMKYGTLKKGFIAISLFVQDKGVGDVLY